MGTSIGGVIGALYASGYSPEEIMSSALLTDWSSILSDAPTRSSLFLGEKEKRARALIQFRLDKFNPVIPEAYTPGQKITKILTELVLNAPYRSSNFSELKIPLKIITTDILTGEKVILDSGDLVTAMRATIAIPLLFTPVDVDSFSLVDGGVVDNIPVKETFNSDTDYVIAVDTTSPLRSKEDMQAPWEIADQVTTIMQQKKDEEQIKQADFLINFEDIRITSTDYDAIEMLFREGQKRAEAVIEKIKKAMNDFYDVNQSIKYNIDKTEIFPANPSSDYEIKHQSIVSEKDINLNLYNLHRKGSLSSIYAELVSDNSDTVLIYHMEFNPTLKKVSFKGNNIIKTEEIDSLSKTILNKPINFIETQNLKENILKLYRKKGLSLASIESIAFDDSSKSATFYIEEGRIINVNFDGNRKTKNFVITRELSLKPGETFLFDNVQQGLENVFATGLFSGVNLTIDEKPEGHSITVHLIEKPSHVVRFGARYDMERKTRVFSEIADENWVGTGNDLSFHLQYGPRDLKTYFDYRADRIFKTYFTGRINIYYNESKHHTYSNFENIGEYVRIAKGTHFELGTQISRFGTLSALLRFEEISLSSISGYGYDTGNLSMNTLGLRTVIDTRDKIPFPNNGKYHIFYYEISTGEFLGKNISYYKVMNQLATFTTFLQRHTICPKLFWGTSDKSTPYSEQFKYTPFYGLKEEQLQGRHLIVASLEYRFFIPKFWRFDTFLSFKYNIGATWEKILKIEGNDFINGYGTAFSFKTPVGPVSLSYGRTNIGQRQLYINIGYEF